MARADGEERDERDERGRLTLYLDDGLGDLVDAFRKLAGTKAGTETIRVALSFATAHWPTRVKP